MGICARRACICASVRVCVCVCVCICAWRASGNLCSRACCSTSSRGSGFHILGALILECGCCRHIAHTAPPFATSRVRSPMYLGEAPRAFCPNRPMCTASLGCPVSGEGVGFLLLPREAFVFDRTRTAQPSCNLRYAGFEPATFDYRTNALTTELIAHLRRVRPCLHRPNPTCQREPAPPQTQFSFSRQSPSWGVAPPCRDCATDLAP